MGDIPDQHLTTDTVSCKQLPTVTTRATCLSKVESSYFRANVSLLESYCGEDTQRQVGQCPLPYQHSSISANTLTLTGTQAICNPDRLNHTQAHAYVDVRELERQYGAGATVCDGRGATAALWEQRLRHLLAGYLAPDANVVQHCVRWGAAGGADPHSQRQSLREMADAGVCSMLYLPTAILPLPR